MKKVTSVGNHHIVEQNGTFGLLYTNCRKSVIKGIRKKVCKDVLLLKPVYNAIRIKNQDLDLESLLSLKLEELRQRAVFCAEDNCPIIEVDGKHGFLYHMRIIPGLEYDAIFKLTYRHYLCRKGNDLTLYRYSNIGFENAHHLFAKIADMEIRGPVNPSSFLDNLLKSHPDVHGEVAKYIIKDGHSDHYISEYRHISCILEDIHFSGAVQRVKMYNDFKTSVLDMRYNPIMGDRNWNNNHELNNA